MTRRAYIEQIRRLIYGGQPSDDADITVGLVNIWLEQGIAYAAKKNYTDTFQLDGIGYVNNSFYTKFTGLTITNDSQFTWKIELPQVPVGIGATEGISTVRFKYDNIYVSQAVVLLTANQSTFFENMRPIQNKILATYFGSFVYVTSTLLLDLYEAECTIISGGDSTDLDSTINVPSDYAPFITEYLRTQLIFERSIPKDNVNDGVDNSIKTI